MGEAAFPLLPYVERFPEKAKAWDIMNAALRSGEITRQPCEVCGKTNRINGHHPDYAKPLDIMWLCTRHHIAWHLEFGPGLNGGDEAETFGYYRHESIIPLGTRFGHLTVTAESDARFRAGRHWVCRCDCGVEIVRSGQVLRGCAAAGSMSACETCVRALQDRLKAQRRAKHRERFSTYGTLYGENYVENETEAIRAEFAAEFGPTDAGIGHLGSLVTAGLDPYWSRDCNSPDTRDGMKQEEIANVEGVSRQRIEQIETKALGRLQLRAKRYVLDGTPLIRAVVIDKPKPAPIVVPMTSAGRRVKVKIRARIRKQSRSCRFCGEPGHDRRVCRWLVGNSMQESA